MQFAIFQIDETLGRNKENTYLEIEAKLSIGAKNREGIFMSVTVPKNHSNESYRGRIVDTTVLYHQPAELKEGRLHHVDQTDANARMNKVNIDILN